METHNGILYITGAELIRDEDNPTGIMPLGTYASLVYRGQIKPERGGGNGRTALIEYNTLPRRCRDNWEALHGKPNREKKMDSFIHFIKTDAEALKFFTGYRLDNGTESGVGLEDQDRERYINEAQILNAVRDMMQGMRERRGRIKGIWEQALGWINQVRHVDVENGVLIAHKLPNTPITLQRKMEKYLPNNYISLIHQGRGNKNSAIAKDEVAQAFLMELACDGRQFDAVLIAETYNLWAEANKRKPISSRAVSNFIILNNYEIMSEREGYSKWANKYDQVVRRGRPSAPLVLINSDDNELDLFFRADYYEKRGNKMVHIKNDYHRYVVYVVLDAYCDYILGYAIGMGQTKELVKEAFRDAAKHIKELTGGYYLPHQIVADRWGVSRNKVTEMEAFYRKQANYTPPRVGLARSKVIERSFGSEWHKTLKRYENYCGHNITAKHQVNPEYVAVNIKSNPNMEEGLIQIDGFIASMRKLEWKDSGMSREQAWITKFNESRLSKEKRISEEVYFDIYGVENTRSVKITNGGIRTTINGTEMLYDVPPEIYRHSVGKSVRVIHDDDLSRVLISGDGGKLRFVATQNNPMPMAIADYQEGDGVRLNNILTIKEDRRKGIKDDKAARKEILNREYLDAQSYLQAGVLTKEVKQDAVATVMQKQIKDSSNNRSFKNLN